MAAELLPRLVRIDARRPASWLAAGSAAASVAVLAAASPDAAVATAAAVFCGGWAGVAAAGVPPRGILPGDRAVDAAWWWERAAWPVVGAAGAWVACGAAAGAAPIAAGAILGVGCATLVGVAAAGRAAPADAASCGLVATAAAAAAGLAGGTAAAALAWAALAACIVVPVASAGLTFLGREWGGGLDAGPARATFAEIGLARGGLRSALSGLAMIASLAGLAGWYFLFPEAAAMGLVATVGWFLALAVPAVLLGPPAGGAGWEPLAAAAAVEAGPGIAWRRPARPRWAVAVAAAHAAILGWPPLVAGLLLAAEATGAPVPAATWAWLTVAALAVAATGLVAVALAFGAAGTRPETAGAVVSGLVVAGLVLAVVRLPELRRLPRDSGQTAVEKMVRLER